MMLGILYFDYDGLGDKKPFSDKDTHTAYRLFSHYAESNGLSVVLGKPEDYEEGHFNTAWDLTTEKKVQHVAIDMCWDRCVIQSVNQLHFMQKLYETISRRMPLVNHPKLISISEDKYDTFCRFKEYVPQTFLGTELEQARDTLRGKVVTKPRYGSHGHDVKIRDISKITMLDDSFIIQPFIDSTEGIPGVIKGAHDLRVTMLNATIVDTYVRYPQKGLISNISLGGKMKILDRNTLPQRVIETAQAVDAHFARYSPRLYSIDFMLEEDRPWIVEFNKAPGIWGHIAVGVSPQYYKRLCTDVINAFIGSLNKEIRGFH